MRVESDTERDGRECKKCNTELEQEERVGRNTEGKKIGHEGRSSGKVRERRRGGSKEM